MSIRLILLSMTSLMSLHSLHGERILALMNLASPSHYIFNRALLVALAGRGHQVVVASPNKEQKTVPNLSFIFLEKIYDTERYTRDLEELVFWSMWYKTFATFKWGSSMCDKQLNTSGAQTLLNYSSSEKFDLIITEVGWGECFFGFIHKFGYPPVIATSAVGIPPWLSYTMSNPENPSYMPTFLLSYTDHMTLSQRLHNFIINNFVQLVYMYYHIPLQETIARKHFDGHLPAFEEITKNFSIVLVNTVFGLDSARPLLPNIIPIGGMHIKTHPEALPQDLQEFLDNASDGFIYFSLGSNLQSDALPEMKRKALLEAFSELPQRIVWKFESDSLPGLPSNVKIAKWLPQSDILAHPNIRMFITHCGMMSTMEAAYWGVPIVGVPFFLDQSVNLKKFITKGAGLELDYVTLTKENALKAVRAILHNDSYRLNMQKLSAIFKDRPELPLDRAVFWTEYVIRYGGATHLRSPANDLYWHQFLLLDVILVLITGPLFAHYFIRTLYQAVKNNTEIILSHKLTLIFQKRIRA